MEDILIKDNWKRESKRWLEFTILFALIGIACPLIYYFKQAGDNALLEAIILAIFFAGMFCIFLYGYLYCVFYKIEVYKDKIVRKSLFGLKSYLIQDIKTYTFKKNNKLSELYQFELIIDFKRVRLYTHFGDELDEILKVQQLKEVQEEQLTIG